MVNACLKYLLKELGVGNCLKLRPYAVRHQLNEVLDEIDKVITDNFPEVLRQNDFKNLDMESVTQVIGKRRQEVSMKCRLLGSALFQIL